MISPLRTKKNKDGGSTRELQSLLAKISEDQETSINTAFDAAVELAKAKGDNSDALVKALESAKQSALEATRETSRSPKDKLIISEKEPLFKLKLNETNKPKLIETLEQIEARQEKTKQLMADWAEVARPIQQLAKSNLVLRKTLGHALIGATLSLLGSK